MKKSTLIALLVFAGLLAAAVATMRQKPERNISRISFAGIDKDAVDKLQITGKNPIEAAKKDGAWVLGDGRDAEESAIKSALEALAKIESSEVVTESGDRFAELEVDDAQGSRVKAFAGGAAVAEVVIGKYGPLGVYVRKGDTVYAVKGISPSQFSKPAAQWHQLKLFSDKLDDVSRVEVALAGEAPWALAKKDGRWSLDDPKTVPAGLRFDESAATSFVSSLVSATAKDILDKDPGAETTKLADTADVLAFVGKDGARRELHLGATADSAVYAQVAGRADVVSLPEYTAKGLRKRAIDLRDLTLMKLEKDKVAKLEIVDGKTKLVLERQGADWKVGSSTEKIPSDFQLDPALVDRRLSTLSTARATKAAAPAAGLDKAPARISAISPEGTATLSFGAEVKEDDQALFPARGNADAETYLVSKWVRDQLLGGLTTFKKQPEPEGPPHFDPSALQNLPPEVRAQLMQQLMQKRGAAPMPPVQAPPPPATTAKE